MTTPSLTVEDWCEFLKKEKRRSRLLPPHEKQKNLISYLFQPNDSWVKQADLCCGRGFGKSFLSIFIATMALSLSPDEVGLFLEPDWKRVRRVFLKKWRQIVPKSLYILNKSDQMITWLPTGSILFYGPRNITGSYQTAEDSELGTDVTFVIDDEAALRCSSAFYVNTLATIREPSNVRFYLTLSTPRIGEYQELVESKGHKLFRGKSSDNPYLPDNYVETLRANMSPDKAERELEGKFVALSGKIWKHWSDEAWPAGNIHHHAHEHENPFVLFFDIGVASSAWLIVQAVEPEHRGHILWDHDPVWVVTAEYMPKRDGSVDSILREIKRDYGTPIRVVAGADLDTRSSLDPKTAQWFITKHFGQVTTTPAKGVLMSDKEVQHDQLSYGILDTAKRRRFCVSKNLERHYPETRRGILEMMREDQFVERVTRGMTFLPKEHRLEHVRDAAMYGAVVCMFPPKVGLYRHQAE
jgi:hypothetical protein